MTWAEIRTAYVGQPPIESLYQPIEHPDFAGWPVVRACWDRMDLMLPALESRGLVSGSVLDLGCHTGWFCREFARRGWLAVGIDRSGPWLDMAIALNGGLQARYLRADVEALGMLPSAEVALCLSAAMYFAEPWTVFARVSEAAPVLVMDFGGMYASRLPFTEVDVIEQMVARTSYTEGVVLGHTGEERRPLVLFSR